LSLAFPAEKHRYSQLKGEQIGLFSIDFQLNKIISRQVANYAKKLQDVFKSKLSMITLQF